MMFSALERKIILFLFLVLGGFWLFFVWWSSREQEKFYVDQMRREAQGIYQYIVLVREWISSHGGIYLKEDGRLVWVTPSHFTKDLANFAAPRKLPFTFKVAVMNTKNPYHVPDPFEEEAIIRFQEGKRKEFWRYSPREGLFRYAAPLRFQEACFSCHGEVKNYQPPACISVTLSAQPFLSELKKSSRLLILGSVSATLLIFIVLFFLLRHFVLKPLHTFIEASQEIERGNLNVRVKIDTDDEWQLLSRCFNEMLDSLVKHQERLEEKIKEATRELHLAYEELKKTEKFRSEFFSNITHDLKTPVTAIKGALDLLDRKGELDPRYLEIMRKNIEKLSKMIKDLLDCAKLEAGQFELLREENDLLETINDAIFMVMPMAQEKKVEILFKPLLKRCVLPFDYEKIEQVLTNLLTNAIKFSPPQGKVIVSVEECEDEIKVAVEDFGPGIPEKDWPRVFEKFYQGANEGREGIGLGLAICKGIVEAHGGKIWIERPSHPGIIFCFSLPKREGVSGKGKDTHH